MKKIITTVIMITMLFTLAVPALAAEDKATEPEVEAAIGISEKQAIETALNDADEKEEDVTVLKNSLTEKETEDGTAIIMYSVKFHTDTTDYKYYIDANTGVVLYKSIVYQDPNVSFKNHSREKGDMNEKKNRNRDTSEDTVVEEKSQTQRNKYFLF